MALYAARLEYLGAFAEFLRNRWRIRVAPLELECGGLGSGGVDGFFPGTQRADIGGNGEDVDLVLPVQSIDNRRHRPRRHAVVRVPAVHQVDNELDLGPRLLREVVLVERRRVP